MAKKEKDKRRLGPKPASELVELEVRATFDTFAFRPLLNGDKLRLVFDVDWKHLPEGTMAKVEKIVQLVGTLTFLEAPVQAESKPDDPKQGNLALGSEEIG